MKFFGRDNEHAVPPTPLERLCLADGEGIDCDDRSGDYEAIEEAIVAHARRVLRDDASLSEDERAAAIARLQHIVSGERNDAVIDRAEQLHGDRIMRLVVSAVARAMDREQGHRWGSVDVGCLDDKTVEAMVQHCGLRMLSYLNFANTSEDGVAPFSLNIPEGTVLDDVYFGRAYLASMDLRRAQMDTIRVGASYDSAKRVDLTQDAVTFDLIDPLHFVVRRGQRRDYPHIRHCPDAEKYTGYNLSSPLPKKKNFFARRHRLAAGIILYIHDKPIGFIKGGGEKSMIALRTVHTSEGAVLRRGQVCAMGAPYEGDLDPQSDFGSALMHLAKRIMKEQRITTPWLRYDLEDYMDSRSIVREVHNARNPYVENASMIPFSPMRFLTEPSLYTALHKMTQYLEEERPPLPRLQDAAGGRINGKGFLRV